MGNCSCIHGTHEEKQIESDRPSCTDKIVRKSLESPIKHPSIVSIEFQSPILNHDSLCKLQSVLRGYLARHHSKTAYFSPILPLPSPNSPSDKPSLTLSDPPKLRQEVLEIPCSQIPDYSSALTKSLRIRLGDFIYSSPSTLPDDLLRRGPVMITENGSVYAGEWNLQNERHGRGSQMWKDGSVYDGFWLHDKSNGKGRMIHSNGDVYEGEWQDDKAHGSGIYIHADGAKYEGRWANDKQHGEGTETWPDGARYQGDYERGLKHGKGRFAWADGSVYEGMFSDNNIHGLGTYEWSDGRKFIGEWKNNKMDGKGVFTWCDGRSYEGEYLDDKKHGVGVFVWPDGRKYEGGWVNGKQEGRGIYTTAMGSRESEWKEGRRVKFL